MSAEMLAKSWREAFGKKGAAERKFVEKKISFVQKQIFFVQKILAFRAAFWQKLPALSGL
ncbi:hypothetical protein [Phocaeicola sp. HCN-6420]|uniref:hypothetical protein n=1 Tax=Phocaeicola sp. HCN-6420 TaxID=3134673 RepID=UPI0030BD6E0B